MQQCVSCRSMEAGASDQDDPIEEDDDVDDQARLPPRLNPYPGKKGRKQVRSSIDLCLPSLAFHSRHTSYCSASSVL